MSTEEVVESLSNPDVMFDQADNPQKFYVHRYPHPGDCSEPEVFPNGSTFSGCSCDPKLGHGGPIKFYSSHLFDGGRTQAEAEADFLRLRVRAAEDFARFTAELEARQTAWLATQPGAADVRRVAD